MDINMIKKCESCGAPLKDNVCEYCSTINREEKINKPKSPVTVKIIGDMNCIVFRKGTGLYKDVVIRRDMGKYTYSTDRTINLIVKGDMNNITFDGVRCNLELNNGDLNNIHQDYELQAIEEEFDDLEEEYELLGEELKNIENEIDRVSKVFNTMDLFFNPITRYPGKFLMLIIILSSILLFTNKSCSIKYKLNGSQRNAIHNE